MRIDSSRFESFFALVRAGLWEQGVRLSDYGSVDFASIYKLSEEQSIVGLVAAGLEQVEDKRVAKQDAIPFLKSIMQLEGRNLAMNQFVAWLFGKLREAGICAILVKGQGVAQCYERPLWRAAGDVDILLDEDNYYRAKEYLGALAGSIDEEKVSMLHLGLTFGQWFVELHGTLRSSINSQINKVVDSVQGDTFCNRLFREWECVGEMVFLPSADSDAVFIFSHILQHLFRGGIGLRQVCDWCRLLWTYRDSIDSAHLESRIRAMGVITEWRTFAALAVCWLGMPTSAMPLYNPSYRWKRKARRVCSYILDVGNFGRNRDNFYYSKYSYLVRKSISFFRRISDAARLFFIFPLKASSAFFHILNIGFSAVAKGK